jgi:hypothetical protein
MDRPERIPQSQDAALVMGLAGTAMPFAHSAGDEVERWLRALRLHGEVGGVMQSIGVSEGSLVDEPAPDTDPDVKLGDRAVAEIEARAERFAAERGADHVSTTDVLSAVADAYGDLFDERIYRHGSTREEILERVGARN